MRRGGSRTAALVVGSVFLVFAGRAAAEPPTGQDVATAQALFDEGKRLMAAGSYAQACPKLVESQRIDPGGGTLFAIALCHESEGKTATAWADFNVAAAEARKDHRADREAAAVEHVRALEPKLVRIRVMPAASIVGLEIRRDGARVGDAQWGTALPIDPGDHFFEASAPGKKAWHKSVEIRGEGTTVDVAIPPLVDDEAPRRSRMTDEPPPSVPATATVDPKDRTTSAAAVDSGGVSQRTWALVAGGVGIVATGVGLGFGLSASSKWSDAEAACPNGRCTDPAKVAAGRDAGSAADIATGLVVVGVVGLAVGVVLWLTADEAAKPGKAHEAHEAHEAHVSRGASGAGHAAGRLASSILLRWQ